MGFTENYLALRSAREPAATPAADVTPPALSKPRTLRAGTEDKIQRDSYTDNYLALRSARGTTAASSVGGTLPTRASVERRTTLPKNGMTDRAVTTVRTAAPSFTEPDTSLTARAAALEDEAKKLFREANSLSSQRGRRRGGARNEARGSESVQMRAEAEAKRQEAAGLREQAAEAEAAEKYRGYLQLQGNEDFAEKSRYKSTYRGGEKFNNWTGSYSDTGFDDILYDYINGNETAQKQQEVNDVNAGGYGSAYAATHSGWKDLPEEVVQTFNYIYATEGRDAAFEYIDFVAERGYTGMEALGYGFMKSTGVDSVSAALDAGIAEITGDGETKRRSADFYNQISRQAAAAGAQNPAAYAAGNVAGNMALMYGLSKGVGAIKGLASMPQLAQSVVRGAATFGGLTAIQEAGAAASGDISAGQYLKDVGVSAAGGALGSAASMGISQLGGAVLSKLRLTQNTFARTIAAGLSGAGFAAGSIGVKELAKYLEYPEGYEPDGGQIMQDVLVAFAFSALSYLASAGPGARQPEAETAETYKSKYFNKDMTEDELKRAYRELSRQYHPDLHPGDPDATAIMQEINRDYDIFNAAFAKRHVASAAEAYKAAATSTGPAAEAAAETFATEVRYLQEAVQSGALATAEGAQAVEILTAAMAGGTAAGAVGNLPVAQEAPSVQGLETRGLVLPSVEGVPAQGAVMAPETVYDAVRGQTARPVQEGEAQALILPSPEGQNNAATESGTAVKANTSLFDRGILKNFNEARKNLIAYAKEHFPKSVVNRNTGRTIGISRNGLDKFLSGNLYYEKYASGFHIPELIQNAVKVAEAGNYHIEAAESIPSYEYYDSPLTIDGADYMAHIRVRNTLVGDKYYGHTIGQVENIEIEPSTRASVPGNPAVQSVNIDGSNGSVNQALDMDGVPSPQLTPEAPLDAVASADSRVPQPGRTVNSGPETFSDAVGVQMGGETPQNTVNGGNGNAAGQITGSQSSVFGGESWLRSTEESRTIPLSDGDTGRRGYERPGERAEHIPATVRNTGGSRDNRTLTAQRKAAAFDQPLISPANAGVPDGSTSETCRILPKADWDEEIRQGVDWAYRKGVNDVVVLVGMVEIERDGMTGGVLGVIDKDNRRVFIRADSLSRSFSETLEHEVGHLLTEEQTTRTFIHSIKSRYREAAWGPVYEAYRRKYATLTNDYAGMTSEQAELYVWEEILEDAYSDTNRFGVRAGVYGAEADAAIEGAAGADEQFAGAGSMVQNSRPAGAESIRGPPERYSFRDKPVPTYAELIAKPDMKVVDIRGERPGRFAEQRRAFLESDAAKRLYAAPVVNQDTGESVFITPQSITHSFSNWGREQITMVERLREIVENAVLTHAEQSRKAPDDNTTGVYTLFGAVRTDTGVQPVKLTVKEFDIKKQVIPKNVADYLGTGLQADTYASVYDGKVLVLEGIEKEGASSSALSTAETAADKYPSAPSEGASSSAPSTAISAATKYPSASSFISIEELLGLVKGDAARYIPRYIPTDSAKYNAGDPGVRYSVRDDYIPQSAAEYSRMQKETPQDRPYPEEYDSVDEYAAALNSVLDSYKQEIAPKQEEREKSALAALEEALGSRKASEKYFGYLLLQDNEDFEEKSRYKSTANGKTRNWIDILLGDYSETGFDDPLYDAINGNEDARQALRNQASARYGSGAGALGQLRDISVEGERQARMLTEEEIGLFNYLYATQGKETAYDFYYFLRDDLSSRLRQEKGENDSSD